MKYVEKIIFRIANFSYNHPIIQVIILALVLILSVSGALQLKMDNSNESFFLEGDKFFQNYKYYQEKYGSDEFIYIVLDFDSEKFFSTYKNLSILNEMSRDLKRINYNGKNLVKEVTSLTNVDYISNFNDMLNIDSFIKDLDQNTNLSKLEESALNEKMYIDSLISSDGTKVGILVETIQLEDDGQFRKYISKYVNELVEEYQNEYKVKITAVGVPILDAAVDLITGEQFFIFFLLAIVVNVFLLLYFYRSFSGVFAPLTIVILSVSLVLAVMSLIKIPLSMVSTIIPPLLIAVSIGDSVHVIHHYRYRLSQSPGKGDVFKETIKSKILPCFFTSITTMAGLLSLTSAKVKPVRHLGIYSALGVFFAFILTFAVVPIFIKKVKPIKSKINKKRRWKFLESIGGIVDNYPVRILVIGLILVLIFIAFIPRVNIESNFVKIFRKNLPIRQNYDYVDETMGGSNSIEVLVNTDKLDGVKDPGFLKKVDLFQERLIEEDLVIKVLGLPDIVKKLNFVLHEDKEEFFVIPDSKDLLNQLLFLYEISTRDAFKGLVDEQFKELHLTVRLQNTSTEEFRNLSNEMEKISSTIFDESVKVWTTGTVPIFIKMAEYLTVSQLRSFIFAFFFITLMMIVTTKSISLGLYSMYSNVLPVIVMFGFMGMTNIPLDFMTVLTCSIAIGVAVDNTIHIISTYKENLEEGKNTSEAVVETIRSVGSAVLNSSFVLGMGFLIMGASQVTSIANFGILAAITVATALVADFFITPAILVLYYQNKTQNIVIQNQIKKEEEN